ncbi:hypothetical protein Mth01_02000 [Sphaerimonospora thailandensis]|uniref:Uncharacterized protein n=1 Tax=Sphaerimonospora thailandensis TaxID=795644 RepID=A0A8J3R5Y3_9ACTN|nr:hypothetical protein Mth01_02000 [Sphaerimonospora thailandensis]
MHMGRRAGVDVPDRGAVAVAVHLVQDLPHLPEENLIRHVAAHLPPIRVPVSQSLPARVPDPRVEADGLGMGGALAPRESADRRGDRDG